MKSVNVHHVKFAKVLVNFNKTLLFLQGHIKTSNYISSQKDTKVIETFLSQTVHLVMCEVITIQRNINII